MNRQALIDRTDIKQCRKLIELYVDKLVVNNNEIKLFLKFWISD